jgi:hypothetical protein
VRRDATKRTLSWDKAAEELNVMSSSPQAADIPARKKFRAVEPLPATEDKAAKKTATPDVSECHASPDTPPSTDTVDV